MLVQKMFDYCRAGRLTYCIQRNVTWMRMAGFRRLLVGAETINYQNTVAVRVDPATDECWLGYIQDLRGDHVLVDFDCAAAPARYIHASRVWPQAIASHSPVNPSASASGHETYPKCCGMSVVAALRDAPDGPFRFRPATVLRFISKCRMYFVSTKEAANASGGGERNVIAVVDRCQLMGRLPFNEAPLLTRTSGILYTQHEFVKRTAAITTQSLFDTRTDARQFVDALRQVYRAYPLAMGDREDSCRFHMRIGSDDCTLVVVDSQNDLAAMDWTTGLLLQLLETHATLRASRATVTVPDHTKQTSRCIEGFSRCVGSNGKRVAKWDAGTGSYTCAVACSFTDMCHLPLILLTEILEVLDLHTQAQARRVCALWQEILQQPRAAHHISILTENFPQTQDGDPHYSCCRIAMVLSRSITAATKSLTITARAHDWEAEEFNWHVESFVRELLENMRIMLPFLIIKSFCLRNWDYPYVQGWFHPHCERLIVDKGEVRDFNYDMCADANLDLDDLPDVERRFFDWHFSAELVLKGTIMSFPRVVCRWGDGYAEVKRLITWALDRPLPPVSAEGYSHVAAVHARWCSTLAYPQEWKPIRYFLNKFSGFHPDGSPHAWDHVDLRNLDLSQLSKLALWGIYGMFKV
ncbi:uncharacterized protein LOC129594440 isoform X2 [Paramacrobiotus metropolitanus]|uniref:uncharacterized protein LOC129594440 isoform X2 n=1 Tax=Paramacrobiotus metropolitanus TaxID=2943436 RepID=UPI002445EE4C|nr:uncharacterized protein LOC129594440 isoform X2 [Paramacrobiotus metropolitanus]